MSEKMFTLEEVNKILELAILGMIKPPKQEELSEMLEGVSPELKFLLAQKLTMGLAKVMQEQLKTLQKSEEPKDSFRDFLKQMSPNNCTCKDDPEITILKNGKPATEEDTREVLNILKKMLGSAES